MVAIDEDFWGEGPMEAIRYVVLELDPSDGTVLHFHGVQYHKLSAVRLGDIQHDQDEAIILFTLSPAFPSQTRDEHWLSNATMGVPHLPLLVLGIILLNV